jgi:outer membrane protein TolC
MKRLYQTLLLTLLIPLWTHAQQQDTTAGFSLEDCIKYALENTVDVKNARVDAQIAEARVKETVGQGLPQINGEVQLAHNQKLQRFFNQYSVVQGFAGVDPETGQPLLNVPGVEGSDIVAMNSPFQLKSTGDAKLQITQLLFSGSYLVGLKAASTYKELAYKTTEQTEIELIQSVTKAYYSVLINKERITLFDNNIGRVDSLLRSTAAMNKNGFSEEIDVDRIQVQLNNLKTERIKFLNSQALSLALLKFQMNYPMGDALQIKGSLQSLKIDESFLDGLEDGWDPKNRIDYKVLETQRELQRLDIKNKYAAGMPKLSAFANLGYATQSPNIGGLFKTETNLKDDGVLGPDKWYSYSMFGVTLNVPIFSGMQRTYQVQQAKLSMVKIENNVAKLNRSIELDIEQNSITFRNALESLKAQEENMRLAAKVARVTKIKYEQGVGSNIEVTDAESSLRESQVNYYNALFDAIIARTDLEKTYGKIDPAKYTQTSSTTNQK